MKKNILIPVVHAEGSKELIFQNIEKVVNAGLDHVFLISHTKYQHRELLEISKEVKEKYPELKVGCNFLDLSSLVVFNELKSDISHLDMIWLDNSYIGLYDREQEAEILFKSWIENDFKGLYFGGVAFKGCEQPISLEAATELAKHRMSVVTTSGVSTGNKPSVEKIITMKRVLGSSDLAIASGISIDNINDYKAFATYFIVSSSIEKEFGVLDQEKLNELAKEVLPEGR